MNHKWSVLWDERSAWPSNNDNAHDAYDKLKSAGRV
jgi:hypothetical protein